MKRLAERIAVLLVGAGLLWGASCGGHLSGEAQRLRYDTVADPICDLDAEFAELALTGRTPIDLEWLAFEGKPLFARWETPLAASGAIRFAFDCSPEDGLPTRLFYDADADGMLADEAPLKPSTEWPGRRTFERVAVRFPGDAGPTVLHLHLEFTNWPEPSGGKEEPHCTLATAGYYRGTVYVGGKTFDCTLIDYNANGLFRDASTDDGETDRIRFERGDEVILRRAGRYVQLDGALYGLDVAPDRAFVRITPADDAPMGAVRVPEGTRELLVQGENGLLEVQLAGGVGKVPAGEYALHSYRVTRRDANGAVWEIERPYARSEKTFQVTADEETRLDGIERLFATGHVRRRDDHYTFSPLMLGSAQEPVALTRNGGRAPLPKLRIRNDEGTYDKAFQFEYG